MRILHCCSDNKFFDGTIRMFDSFDGVENIYAIIGQGNSKAKYIKSNRIEIHSVDWYFKNAVNNYNFDIVILHNFDSLPVDIISKTHNRIKVIWLSWGYDIYEKRMPVIPLVRLRRQYKTERIKHLMEDMKSSIRIYLSEIRHGFERTKTFRDSLKRIDYYSGVFPEEYQLLRKKTCFRAKELNYNYPFEYDIISENNLYNLPPKNRTNLMVGHQANPLLNHKATYRKLSKLDLPDNVRIISPLSYGKVSDVNNAKKDGFSILGERFMALTDFMPFDEYTKLFQTVNAVIYNIERQCAVGNVIIAIWNGIKVFMPKHSLNYKFFKNAGYQVFSIEKHMTKSELTTELSEEQILTNRRLLLEFYSDSALFSRVRKSLTAIS